MTSSPRSDDELPDFHNHDRKHDCSSNGNEIGTARRRKNVAPVFCQPVLGIRFREADRRVDAKRSCNQLGLGRVRMLTFSYGIHLHRQHRRTLSKRESMPARTTSCDTRYTILIECSPTDHA
jgi:hypothetical protein